MKYRAKIVQIFEQVVEVEADSVEEAEEKIVEDKCDYIGEPKFWGNQEGDDLFAETPEITKE